MVVVEGREERRGGIAAVEYFCGEMQLRSMEFPLDRILKKESKSLNYCTREPKCLWACEGWGDGTGGGYCFSFFSGI